MRHATERASYDLAQLKTLTCTDNFRNSCLHMPPSKSKSWYFSDPISCLQWHLQLYSPWHDKVCGNRSVKPITMLPEEKWYDVISEQELTIRASFFNMCWIFFRFLYWTSHVHICTHEKISLLVSKQQQLLLLHPDPGVNHCFGQGGGHDRIHSTYTVCVMVKTLRNPHTNKQNMQTVHRRLCHNQDLNPQPSDMRYLYD